MRTMHELLDTLADVLGQGVTFAAFKEPGKPVRLMVQRELHLRSIAEAGDDDRGFLIAPFDGTVTTACWLRPDLDRTVGDAPAWDPSLLNGSERIEERKVHAQAPTSRAQHRAIVEQALDRIAKGELEKVVLSRVKRIGFDPGEAAGLFVELLATCPAAFVCLLHTADHGLWIGAAPERLVAVEDSSYTVDAVAGTMPSDIAPPNVKDWGGKEKEEQAWVERDIRSKLTELGLPPTAVTGPEVHAAGPVSHLRTRFTGPLDHVPVVRMAAKLHPTPAVGGTPTGPAQDFIRNSEMHERRLYAGYWGPWSENGRSSLYVNLRCMEIGRQEALLYLGGGITAGSDADREWEETEAKALTLERPMAAVLARIP